MASTETTQTTKLVPHGSGLAILLDPDLLRDLGIDENTPVEITTDGRSIKVTAAMRQPTDAELKSAMDRVNAKWGSVLRKLAE